MNRSRKTFCLGRALALLFGVTAAFALIEIAGRLYFRIDGHFNPARHRLTAEL